MPAGTPQSVRVQIAKNKPDPVYLIMGDDDAEMSALATDLSGLVEDELRAFNLDRVYAGDKSCPPESIAQSARTIPMLGDRRVVLVLRAEKLLKPRGRGADENADADAEAAGSADALTEYVKRPESSTTLVFVASDVDKRKPLYKALQKTATIVECWGLKGSRDARTDLRESGRMAERLVKQAVTAAGQQIDPAAVRLIAERAGTDIATLRGDVERLLLYAAGKPKIDVKDVQEVVTAETAQDDWAVTNAIQRGDTAEALRQVGLAMESGAVAFQMLGQLGWFVREKLPGVDVRRVPAAVEALFRTDIELKSSGGDPRVLMERLVVELCRR